MFWKIHSHIGICQALFHLRFASLRATLFSPANLTFYSPFVGISGLPAHNGRRGSHQGRMLASVLWLIAVGIVFIVPALLLWGWLRLSKDHAPRTLSWKFSLAGFSFATASALLALFAHLYARFIHSFPYYDPVLFKIYGTGSLLSIAGIALAVAGTGHKNPVRWLAPVCAFGTLVFWLLAMTSE